MMSKYSLWLLIPVLCVVAGCARTAGERGEFPVFDMHSDILLRVLDNEVDLLHPPDWPQATIPSMRAGNVEEQVFAVWVNQRTHPGAESMHRALSMIDVFYEQQALHSDHIALATTSREAAEIRRSGRIPIWLFIEGGSPINNDLALLRMFHRLGVRGMTLTWTSNLDWAGSSSDRENDQMGLTEFGREVVREMNRLGMVVDVSHASEETFYDVLETTTHPIIASHSGVRALVDHDRNLTDDQLRALAANGGVIGIVFLPGYLDEGWSAAWREAEERVADDVAALLESLGGDRSDPLYREGRRQLVQGAMGDEGKVTIDTVIDHIEHAVRVAGIDHVGIGADYDGMWAFPEGLEKPTGFPALAERMRERGFSDSDIHAIFTGNARRVFAEVVGD